MVAMSGPKSFNSQSARQSAGQRSRHPLQRNVAMPSRIANGLIAIGGLGIFMGFVVMLSGRAGHPDSAIVMMGACALSLGSLLAAGGMYVKAKSVQGTVSPR